MPHGTLEVVLVDAKDLHDTSFLTKMDPYVIFTVKTQEKTSTVAQGQGTNPEWNESFLFTVTDDVTELRLKIMDKDTLPQMILRVKQPFLYSQNCSLKEAFHQLHTMLLASTRSTVGRSQSDSISLLIPRAIEVPLHSRDYAGAEEKWRTMVEGNNNYLRIINLVANTV